MNTQLQFFPYQTKRPSTPSQLLPNLSVERYLISMSVSLGFGLSVWLSLPLSSVSVFPSVFVCLSLSVCACLSVFVRLWCEALFVTKLPWGSEALIFRLSELASRIDFAKKIAL